jgi:hypothetical protein
MQVPSAAGDAYAAVEGGGASFCRLRYHFYDPASRTFDRRDGQASLRVKWIPDCKNKAPAAGVNASIGCYGHHIAIAGRGGETA